MEEERILENNDPEAIAEHLELVYDFYTGLLADKVSYRQ
jgi:hypothetical protein